jgi:CheY-like chemotaxis protein
MHPEAEHPPLNLKAGLPMQIIILEDNDERRQHIRSCLADHFPQYDLRFFVSATEMLDDLRRIDLNDVVLIALDHDLELLPTDDGRMVDPGDGRDVANSLAGRTPTCPVIIHTTNTPAGDSMRAVLRESGWKTLRVVPYGCHEWISQTWFRAVRKAIAWMDKERSAGD